MWKEIPKPTREGRWFRKYELPREWLDEVGARIEQNLIILCTEEDVLEWLIAYKDPETLVYTCTETTIVGIMFCWYLKLKRRLREWIITMRYLHARKSSATTRRKNSSKSSKGGMKW